MRDESLAERQGQTEERTEREALEIATVISFAIKGSRVMGQWAWGEAELPA